MGGPSGVTWLCSWQRLSASAVGHSACSNRFLTPSLQARLCIDIQPGPSAYLVINQNACRCTKAVLQQLCPDVRFVSERPMYPGQNQLSGILPRSSEFSSTEMAALNGFHQNRLCVESHACRAAPDCAETSMSTLYPASDDSHQMCASALCKRGGSVQFLCFLLCL